MHMDTVKAAEGASSIRVGSGGLITARTFEKDMRYLASMGYKPYSSFEDLEAMLKEEDQAITESMDMLLGSTDYMT